MRTAAITFLITAVWLCFSIGFENQQAYSVSGGAPQARTGSPSDGATCMDQCHGANPGTPNGNEAIALTGLPVGGYVLGETYDLTLSATGSSNNVFGFQITPQDWQGNMQGTWIMGTSGMVQIVGTNWLTHTYSGTSGSNGQHSWDFQWTAPTTGAGNVNFYFTTLFGDGMNGHLGDVMLQDSVILPQNTSVGVIEEVAHTGAIVRATGHSIHVSNYPVGELNMEVFNLEGRQIYQSQVLSTQHVADLAAVSSSGIYIVVLRGTDFYLSQRVVLMDY